MKAYGGPTLHRCFAASLTAWLRLQEDEAACSSVNTTLTDAGQRRKWSYTTDTDMWLMQVA